MSRDTLQGRVITGEIGSGSVRCVALSGQVNTGMIAAGRYQEDDSCAGYPRGWT